MRGDLLGAASKCLAIFFKFDFASVYFDDRGTFYGLTFFDYCTVNYGRWVIGVQYGGNLHLKGLSNSLLKDRQGLVTKHGNKRDSAYYYSGEDERFFPAMGTGGTGGNISERVRRRFNVCLGGKHDIKTGQPT